MGVITLASQLDREKIDNYYVPAEARDGGGLITFVNLNVRVLDVNDHAPVFRLEEYYTTVKEDSLQFIREKLVLEVMYHTGEVTLNMLNLRSDDLCKQFGSRWITSGSKQFVIFTNILFEQIPF